MTGRGGRSRWIQFLRSWSGKGKELNPWLVLAQSHLVPLPLPGITEQQRLVSAHKTSLTFGLGGQQKKSLLERTFDDE